MLPAADIQHSIHSIEAKFMNSVKENLRKFPHTSIIRKLWWSNVQCFFFMCVLLCVRQINRLSPLKTKSHKQIYINFCSKFLVNVWLLHEVYMLLTLIIRLNSISLTFSIIIDDKRHARKSRNPNNVTGFVEREK